MPLNYDKIAPWVSGVLITSGCLIGAVRGGYLVDARLPGISLYVAPTVPPATPAPTPSPVSTATPAPVLASPAVSPAPEPETIPDYQLTYDSVWYSLRQTFFHAVPFFVAIALVFWGFAWVENHFGRSNR